MTDAGNAVPPKAHPPADPSRHARKCCICVHPDRADIEDDYLHWFSPEKIARDYHLYDRRAIYRHAHATGLASRRSRKLRFVLELFLERAEEVCADASPNVTATDVISAVKLYAHINNNGELISPPRTIHLPPLRVKVPFPDSPRSKETAYETPAPGQPVNRHQTKSTVSP